MAAVKTERSIAGHKTPPKRPKDWVAPAKVITAKPSPFILSTFTPAIPAPEPKTDDQRKALMEFDAASKRVAKGAPNDRGAEGAYAVAYALLVQMGLRPRLRGRYRK